ncbi:aspartate/glutamate racemase family protein [Alkalilimnicola ehrlichii]|nr:aspartate/glutamate racemase family protein [Alkalilimnicola ehrlichii]
MQVGCDRPSRPTVVIGGGVGPLAGVFLHEQILRHTKGVQRDSDHLDIWHVADVSTMPDRTAFLLGSHSDNPSHVMARNLVQVGEILYRAGRYWVLAVPCGTFHAVPILTPLIEACSRSPSFLGLYHLIEETLRCLHESPAKPYQVGVLSTLGAYSAGVWREPLTAAGFAVLEPEMTTRAAVHDAIYNPQLGLKSVTPPSETAYTAIVGAVAELAASGADAVILGCTELQFVRDKLVDAYPELCICDPVSVLAQSLSNLANGATPLSYHSEGFLYRHGQDKATRSLNRSEVTR